MFPAFASAHAYLIKTSPVASGVLNAAPANVALSYDEAVERRFAIISVTNDQGRQETTEAVRRSGGMDFPRFGGHRRKSTAPNSFALRITQNHQPVRHANVPLTRPKTPPSTALILDQANG